MSWNYRIVKRKWDNKEVQYSIHEIYYDKDDNIKMFSADPIFICGDSKKELKKDLELYKKAFEKPVLDYKKLCKRFNIKSEVDKLGDDCLKDLSNFIGDK